MKKIKIPGLFRKKYKEKVFNKKILKRIHIPKDREKVQSLFVKNESGRFVLIEDIPEETLKKLKPLAKTIKKNKGFVSTWKTAIVLIVVGSVVLFNFIFKDKLIEKALESGLESVFLAESDVQNAHLSLLKGIFSFESMTIADVDKPMHNLIETGRAEFKISIKELTFKRVHIDEVSMLNVLWNTRRDKDGTLNRDNSLREETAGTDSSSLLNTLAVNSGDFDYQSIINDQKEKLQSLKLIENNNQYIRETKDRWAGLFETKEAEIQNLSDNLNTVRSINVSNIQSISEAQSLVSQVQSYYPEVKKVKNSVGDLSRDFNLEKSQIISMRNTISSTVDSDLDFLVDSLDLSMGDLRSIASDLAEDYIRARWNSYYETGLKIWDIFKRFQNREKKEGKDKTGIHRDTGRNIIFPYAAKPSFFIKHIELTGGDESSGHLAMNVTSVSSEPDKTADPTEFDLILTKANQLIDLNGVLDLKSDSDYILQMNLNVPDIPVELEQGIPSLGISRISSDADLQGKVTAVRGESSLEIELDVILSEINPVFSEGDGFLTGTVENLFRSNNEIELTGAIEVNRQGIGSVSVQSNFDRMIYNSLGGYLSEQKDEIAKELKNNLLKYIGPELEMNELLASSLDDLGLQSLKQISSVDRLEEELDSKVHELENKGNVIVSELKSEAASVLDKAKDKIKLPGF